MDVHIVNRKASGAVVREIDRRVVDENRIIAGFVIAGVKRVNIGAIRAHARCAHCRSVFQLHDGTAIHRIAPSVFISHRRNHRMGKSDGAFSSIQA